MYKQSDHILRLQKRVMELEDSMARAISHIKELKEGSCRFHCRNQKKAFMSGVVWADFGDTPERAYKQWLKEQREKSTIKEV